MRSVYVKLQVDSSAGFLAKDAASQVFLQARFITGILPADGWNSDDVVYRIDQVAKVTGALLQLEWMISFSLTWLRPYQRAVIG
jgi:hypothetical protein